MNAAEIATALGGQRFGTYWMACCPAHNDRKPSLSLCDAGEKVLIYCHAGCDALHVIEQLRKRGLWTSHYGVNGAESSKRPSLENRRDFAVDYHEYALTLWKSAQPPQGSLVETYLTTRGISCELPQTVRFHPSLRHPAGRYWPVMIALVQDGISGLPRAIHRTFLAEAGTGKAPVPQSKLMLGPCAGGAVRLAEPGETLLVGEGIETCLSAMLVTGLPTWAALSTSGLRKLLLPATARDIVVLADGDAPGEEAALYCARRWSSEGRRVRIARAPAGLDFNDLLRRQNPSPDRVTT